MSAFTEIIENYTLVEIIIFLLLAVTAVKGAIEGFKYIKGLFDNYHTKKSGEEKKEQTVDERITKLEEHDKWQYNELQIQSAVLMELKQMLVEMKAENDKNVIATNRHALNQIATKVIQRGYITQTEYETFKDLSDIYLAKGGNHTMKDKIIPEVLNLPIK